MMPDQYDLGNIASFISGFAGQREKIAAANQEDKNYKLSTVQTLFQFAEGKRAEAEASRLLSGDTNLSANEQEKHRLAYERHTAEGERLYAGASELFGLIDDKPKTGKKENPAMQFLKFVNPFTRRGPGSGGEFETELSALLSTLGGGKGAKGGAGESPGFTLGGIGGAPPTGQGAGDPEKGPALGALEAAIPGVGPTPRLPAAEGPVSPAAATLAAQQRPVAGSATGEAQEAGVPIPTATAITPTPEQRLQTPPMDLYPHIIGTRAAYRDLSLTDYNERINKEGQEALLNLNTYLQSTPIRETFADAMNDPDFTKHYRPAARAFQDLDAYDTFQTEIAAIFPEMRQRPPEAGFALAADVARRFRIETQAGKFGDASTWSPETIAAVEAFDAWAAMQPDLSPEFSAMRLYIRITRKDPLTRTPQDERDIKVFMDLYNKNIFGTAQSRAGGVNYTFPKAMNPEGTAQIIWKVDPANPQGAVPLMDATGNQILAEGLDTSDWLYTSSFYRDPDTHEISISKKLIDVSKVYDQLQIPGNRSKIEALLGTEMFDRKAQEEIQTFLNNNPNIGKKKGREGEGEGGGGGGVVVPTSPFGRF